MLQKNFFKKLFQLIIILSIGLTANPYYAVNAQETPLDQAQNILEQLSVEEKIGQLFYITLPGASIDELEASWAQINHIPLGGVYLTSKNNNFTTDPDALEKIFTINNGLQLSAYNNTLLSENTNNTYIPLFLGISLENGDDAYFSSVDSALQFPSQMAVAATWNNDLAYQYGQTIGETFSSLGFNLYDGFSLDMLVDPTAMNETLIGTRSFGGNPAWVSQLGIQVVSGIKQASDNQLLVVSQNFPEISHSDRDPSLEIPTIRRSLIEMEKVELLPYISLTSNAYAQMDGFTISPIRYQGLKGDILSATKPIIFDQQALETFLSLDGINTWKQSSGLIITSPLNSQSIRHYDNPLGNSFNASGIARDALIAGNDVLKFEVSTSIEGALNYDEFLNIYQFFIQKYNEDVAFAERVDQAVLSILKKKLSIYPEFKIESIIQDQYAGLNQNNPALFFKINRNAFSLISPTIQELESTIPVAPNTSEKILIFTEMDYFTPCVNCEQTPRIATSQLEDTILSLYGNEGPNAIFDSYINSYTFSYLNTLLDQDADKTELDILFNSSDWIIFLLSEKSHQTTDALSRLLSERPDLIEQKKSFAFSMSSPNVLDATAISKLTAYYTLYSQNENVIDIAARTLFKEINPLGASPISVTAMNYKIEQATAPNAEQTIPFNISPIYSEEQSAQATQIAEDPSLLEYRVGDSVILEIGEITDQNGNPLADGSEITIETAYMQEGAQYNNQFSAKTNNGYVTLRYMLEYSGTFSIQAYTKDQISSSEQKTFYILSTGEESPALTPAINSTPLVTETPLPTNIIQPTTEPLNTDTPMVQPTSPNGESISPSREQTNFFDWLIMLLLSVFFAIGVYTIWAATGNVRWAIRSAIFTFMLNTLGNTYISIGLPGAKYITQSMRVWGYILILFLMSVLSFTVTYIRYKTRK